MTKKCGLIDRDLQPADQLEENVSHAVDVKVGGPNDEDELIDALAGMDVIFTTSRLTLSERVLEASDLELIAKLGTGIDNVDLEAATRLGIPVTHTPGLNAMSVAEHTVGLLLATTHRIGQTQDLLRKGGWRDEAPFGSQLYGKTVGIIGYGNIGRRVAKLLSGFEPQIFAYDPYIREINGELAGANLTSFESVLAKSDVVCVNAELTEETRGLVDADAIAQMKSSAILVNTARGPLVDTTALVEAIQAGELAGAGLDVYEEEPLPVDSPLHQLENVITTPHVAAMTTEYRELAIDTLSENTLTLLRGQAVSDDYLAVAPDT